MTVAAMAISIMPARDRFRWPGERRAVGEVRQICIHWPIGHADSLNELDNAADVKKADVRSDSLRSRGVSASPLEFTL
jgi:hypothetical protein